MALEDEGWRGHAWRVRQNRWRANPRGAKGEHLKSLETMHVVTKIVRNAGSPDNMRRMVAPTHSEGF